MRKNDEEDEEDLEAELIDFSELGRNYRLGTSAPPILFIYPHGKDDSDTEQDTDTWMKTLKHKKYTKEEKGVSEEIESRRACSSFKNGRSYWKHDYEGYYSSSV